MSDTRAAIRELRTLSEKRSLGALSEPDAARWLALRRQLGLPLEPAGALDASSSASAVEEPPPTPSFASQASLGEDATPALKIEAPPTGNSRSLQEGTGALAMPPASPALHAPEGAWAGPALVAPSAPSAAAWGGPSLDAPAWSDAVAERPTDPGLDEPPPVPFDEAPAALRPPESTEVADFGGSPDERVPLAAASEFVSYAREGQEAIELPAETGPAVELEPQSLAQLASAELSPAPAAEEGAAEAVAQPAYLAGPGLPEGVSDEVSHFQPQLQPVESPGVYEGVLPEPPFEPASPEALGVDMGLPPPVGLSVQESLGVFEGVLPEVTPALEAPLALPEESPGVYEGVLPEPPEPPSPEAFGRDVGLPLSLDVSAQESLAVFEGVLPEAALELEAPLALAEEGAVPERPLALEEVAGIVSESPLEPGEQSPQGDEATLLQPPLQLFAPLEEPQAAAAPDVSLGDAFPEASTPLPSTWAPGAAEPPVLCGDDFARTGDPLGGRGLDPWPEALPTEVSAEDVVETVGDEDVVEELPTPTPLPPFPTAAPPGSGGIRGFQFPKPPPGPVPAPPAWQRTQPGEPAFSRSPPAAVPPQAVAPRTPPPASLRPPTSVSLPVPPPPPPRAVRPASVPLPTPVPTPSAPKPIPPSAVAPVTPRPTPGPGAQVPRPTPVPGRFETLLAPPAPPPSKAPILTAPADVEQESVQPLLDLVDEVEPPRSRPPVRPQPTPSPPQGTPAVFGPPMMLNPSFVEGDHRVVIHTLEGQVHRGTVHNLDLQEDALAVQQPDGRSVELPTRRLKAVFFVLSPGEKPLPGRGERVQVTFRDGRQVVGYSDDHATGEPGFFVVPSDARTNTARVYVFRGGVQSITTG